jgi:tripartite-type tricarboxylate transporter receptor subunit TctC
MMVNGLVMVGAILTNNSAVTLDQTTPIARLTGEYLVIVVPANSELKTLADLTAKLKADPGAMAIGGGSAGGTDHILAGLAVKAAGGDVTKLNYVPFSGGGEALAAGLIHLGQGEALHAALGRGADFGHGHEGVPQAWAVDGLIRAHRSRLAANPRG